MTRAFHPRLDSVAKVTLAQTIALGLPSAVVALNAGPAYIPLLAAAIGAALLCELLFAVLRKRTPGMHGITTALIVAAMAPQDLAMWQVVLVVALGVTLAELVFGGRGFGFVAPATVALALLLISFPQAELAQPSYRVALATLPGATLLLALGLISSRVILGAAGLVIAAAVTTGTSADLSAIVTALTFGLVFLICDPTSAAATNPGRWLYGALAGGLIVALSPTPAPMTESIVFAALIASVFAPLIDHLVVLTHARRRQRRASHV